MLDVIMNHMIELIVGAMSTAAVGLWAHIALTFRRNNAKLNEFVSMPKDVHEVHKKVEQAQVRMASMQATLTDLHLEIKARGDLNIDAAEFTCDSDGAVTNVNLTFARWLGVDKSELLRWGWINYIHPDDRERVRAEWQACIKDHRIMNIKYRIVEVDGDVAAVSAVATPIPDAPPARQWVGVIRKELR